MNIKINGYNNYNFDEKYVNLIYKSIEKFNKKVIDISNIEFPTIDISETCYIDSNFHPTDKKLMGTYNQKYKRIILIKKPLTKMEETIIHEIGHHIHYVYFNNQDFNWNTNDIKNRYGEYGIKDEKEMFAYVFQNCYFFNKENYGRNELKMINLLKQEPSNFNDLQV